MFIFPITIKVSQSSRRRGSIALAALAALVVVFIIGLGLLALGGNARLSGKRAMRLNGAQAMAAAGIEYGYWQRIYNGQPLPYTGSRTLGSGRFTVTVTDNSANTAGTIQIVSTGAQSGDSVMLTRILPVTKTVFDYALCSGSDLYTPQTVTTGAGGVNGDVGANGNISLNRGGTVVNGDATATGDINIRSMTGTETPNSAGITFPAIDIAHYQSIAVQVYNSSQTFSGAFTFPPPSSGVYPVIVVNGNVTMNAGTISGIGTVVVTGSLTFTGNISYLYSTDKVAILTSGSIINGAPAGIPLSVVGFYYAHNGGGSAALQQTNSAAMKITGSMAADTYYVNGPLISAHDPAMNGTLGQQMQLPGY